MLLAQRENLNALEKPYNYLLMRHMKKKKPWSASGGKTYADL